MRDDATLAAEAAVWGPYPSYDDVARLEYGRRLWRQPEMRRRLLAHWLDERHPHRERFLEQRELIESVLASEDSVPEVDARLRECGTSLRCVAREIPAVFGQWFAEERGSSDKLTVTD
jgi:hypothetical protein